MDTRGNDRAPERARWWCAAPLLALAMLATPTAAAPVATPRPDLVKQANAPLSSVFQIRLLDTYVPEWHHLDGDSNTVTLSVTMPLPEYRLLPVPQLSLLALPAAFTLPNGQTEVGDLRFTDVVVLHAKHDVVWGIGPSLVFPTASAPAAGQGKWQVGPAVAAAVLPGRWLLGVLAQNPVSVGGDRDRADTNALLLQPFVTYQLGAGWFVRSQPVMVFNWKTGRQTIPLDVGIGRVFALGRRSINCFVEPFWNVRHEDPGPTYGVSVGVSFLYPDFWRGSPPETDAPAP